jgi:TetR/AcrR family transcriptional repressor of nem operon
VFEETLAVPREELRRGCFVLNSAGEMGPRDPDVAEIAAATLARQERAFAGALRRGVRSGELALTPRRIEELARFFVGALQGVRMVARADPGSPALRDMVAVAMRSLDDAARRKR